MHKIIYFMAVIAVMMPVLMSNSSYEFVKNQTLAFMALATIWVAHITMRRVGKLALYPVAIIILIEVAWVIGLLFIGVR